MDHIIGNAEGILFQMLLSGFLKTGSGYILDTFQNLIFVTGLQQIMTDTIFHGFFCIFKFTITG